MKVKKLFASFLCLMCAAFVAETAFAEDGGMPVTLTVNGKAISARLDDSRAGRSLAEQLPLTVRLNDSGTGGYPKNSNNKYVGPVTVSYAVQRSINTVACRVLEKLGYATSFASLGTMAASIANLVK